MALGLSTESTGGGDILPIIKFDAKSGDFIKQDRVNVNGMWEKQEEDLSLPTKIAFDFENLQVGWLSFASGAPDFQMVKVGEAMPAKPSDEHKQAFRLKIYKPELGVREFSHSAKTVIKALDVLHNQYEAEKGHNEGKVPIVNISGLQTVKVNSPQGELRFKAPEWSISEWIDRPSAMDGAGSSPAPVAAAPTPAPQPSGSDLF
jgi:hypothetical protein